MKDKIKEILYKMEDISYNYKANFLELHYKDVKMLLDYITNLQEENERLKSKIDEVVNKQQFIEEKLDYKSRNEKAINYIRMYYYTDLYDDTLTAFEDKLLNILQGSDNNVLD